MIMAAKQMDVRAPIFWRWPITELKTWIEKIITITCVSFIQHNITVSMFTDQSFQQIIPPTLTNLNTL